MRSHGTKIEARVITVAASALCEETPAILASALTHIHLHCHFGDFNYSRLHWSVLETIYLYMEKRLPVTQSQLVHRQEGQVSLLEGAINSRGSGAEQ